MNSFVTSALMYAMEHHAGQTYPRKTEEWPFIVHPVAVALRVSAWTQNRHVLVAALLHDVVEDTSVTLRAIEFRFGDIVRCIVDRLTRRDGEVYTDYIQRVGGYDLARIVKIADLQENLQNCLSNDAPDFMKSLIPRYQKALSVLLAE